MVDSSGSAAPPPSGTWLDLWLPRRARRHPLVFTCGVRVLDGAVPGERARWRFRDSALDPYRGAGVVLNHGSDVTLRLDGIEPVPDVRTRPAHLVLTAVDVPTGATVQLSVPLGEVESFGVELP